MDNRNVEFPRIIVHFNSRQHHFVYSPNTMNNALLGDFFNSHIAFKAFSQYHMILNKIMRKIAMLCYLFIIGTLDLSILVLLSAILCRKIDRNGLLSKQTADGLHTLCQQGNSKHIGLIFAKSCEK